MMLLTMLLTLSFQPKDIHTLGNPAVVRPTHLSLDLRLSFDDKTITGLCEMSLAYQTEKAGVAVLDLDSSGLAIHRITVPGSDGVLRFEVGPRRKFLGERLRVFLPELKPDRILISYTTSPSAGALQWLAPEMTTSKKMPFLFTQSQPILARTWIPCVDSPAVRVSYDAVVRVPKGMIAVMSAHHGKHDAAEGVFRFELKHSIPTYLIALAVGELEFRELSKRTGIYAEPAVLEKAAWEFADMERMISATEDLYGAYRWGRWDTIILPSSFPFGGMENPLLTFATPTIIAGDRSLVSLMAHELAHSWSGNLVTNATWSDFWLNEGITTYIERRIVESLYGHEIANMQKLLGQRDLAEEVEELNQSAPKDTILFIDLAERDPDDGFTHIPYEKGANFLTVLEHHFGRKKSDAFLNSYFTHFSFQSISTAQFLDFLKTSLFIDKPASWDKLRVVEWVYREGVPTNIIVPKSNKFERTRAAAKYFLDNGELESIGKTPWVTAEWLNFLNSLPGELCRERLDQLEHAFRLSKSGNSEILFAWLLICVRNNYEPAFPALEDFLTRQGRRKFLKPLYQAMQTNPETREMGKSIYQKARAGYHPISAGAIDPIVK